MFFREAKQILNFGKDKCSDFDGQIAGMTISMIQYITLTLHKRINTYQTMYGLFEEEQNKNRELVLAEKIWDQFLTFMLKVIDNLDISYEKLCEAVVKTFYDLKLKDHDGLFKDISLKYQEIMSQ